MYRVEIKGITEIREMGYRIVKNSKDCKKAANIVNRQTGKTEVEILFQENSTLMVKFNNGDTMSDVKKVSIFPTELPKLLLLEMQTIYGKKYWGQLPMQKDLPTFWN